MVFFSNLGHDSHAGRMSVSSMNPTFFFLLSFEGARGHHELAALRQARPDRPVPGG